MRRRLGVEELFSFVSNLAVGLVHVNACSCYSIAKML